MMYTGRDSMTVHYDAHYDFKASGHYGVHYDARYDAHYDAHYGVKASGFYGMFGSMRRGSL